MTLPYRMSSELPTNTHTHILHGGGVHQLTWDAMIGAPTTHIPDSMGVTGLVPLEASLLGLQMPSSPMSSRGHLFMHLYSDFFPQRIPP